MREAFIKLAEAVMVQMPPQRGTFVRKISARRVADGRFILEAVEVAVVRRAATEAASAALVLIKHNLKLQQLAADRHDSQAFMLLDDAFHRLIAQSINCELAWDTVENINAATDRVHFLTLSNVSPRTGLLRNIGRSTWRCSPLIRMRQTLHCETIFRRSFSQSPHR